MSRALARLIVRCSAWVAPGDQRARWREEWLAEIAADVNQGCHFPRKRHPRSFFLRALGAPLDALALRRLARPSRERQSFHLGQWRNDLRYTARLLVRSPGYVATVVLGLGAGLTATIAMYSAINTGLHGDIPGIVDRDALVRVRPEYTTLRSSGPSIDTLPLLWQHGPHIVDVAAQGQFKTSIRINGAPASIRGAFASDSLFQMLGTQPLAGRLLGPADDTPDAEVVVLGYRFWQVQFGGQPDAIGQSILINDRLMRVVGVAPDQFRGLWSGPMIEADSSFNTPDIWLPLAVARTWTGAPGFDNLLGTHLDAGARLAPGVTRQQAAAEFRAIARAFEARDPGNGPVVIHVQALILGRILDDALWLAAAFAALLGMPLALLAIGCANVANLRLARATARTQELAVRLSLGATRRQLTRLLVIESTLLTMLSLFVSALATQALIILVGPHVLALPIRIDWRVAGFSVAVATAVIFISGFAPGWLVTRRATAHAMRQTAQSGGVAHSRLRNTLVIVQIAMSLGLLAFGSLLLRSTLAVAGTRPADFERLLVAQLDFAAVGHDSARANELSAAVLKRLGADSRWSAAGLAQFEPFRRLGMSLKPADPASSNLYATFNRVTTGWFGAVGLAPTAGRLPRPDDRDVAVLNESAARVMSKGGSVVGLRVSFRGDDDSRGAVDIVGVVPDLERDLRQPLVPAPFIYLPLTDPNASGQKPFLYAREAASGDLSRELVLAVAAVDSRAPWIQVRRGTDLFDQGTSDVREMAQAVTIMAVVALAVAAAGLFAVMAYTVALRTREIGIRIALGARRQDITWLVQRQALRLSLTGASLGFVLAQLISVPLNRALLGLSSFDPLALMPVAGLLITIALAAGALPARRAASVNPVTALRAE